MVFWETRFFYWTNMKIIASRSLAAATVQASKRPYELSYEGTTDKSSSILTQMYIRNRVSEKMVHFLQT